MGWKIFCILGVVFFGLSLANARVFYGDGTTNNVQKPLRTSYRYPMNYPIEENEQASRDLDMSFSVGDPNELPEERTVLYPAKKIYAYETPERPIFEMDRPYGRLVPYHKFIDLPTRKIAYGEQYPISNRKLVKMNDNGARKGDIVLELRVTANNHDDVEF